MITIGYNEYIKMSEDIDDYITENLCYESQLKLKTSFNILVKGLIEEDPIPHNVKGSLCRHILLDPNYERAAKESIIYNNTRNDSLGIQIFRESRYIVFEKGIKLVDIIKKLKRNWAL
jgi:hypothetical protein